jgi:hypothetical protein
MCAEKVDCIIILEGMLRAVSVVNVEIDDKNFFIPYFLSVTRTDGDIVEDAKSHRGRGLGMVPGGTDRAKSPLDLTLHTSFYRLNYRPHGISGRFETALGYIGIRIEIPGLETLDPIDISLVVNKRDVFEGSLARANVDEVIPDRRILKDLDNGDEPFFIFSVKSSRFVFQKNIIVEKADFVHCYYYRINETLKKKYNAKWFR